MTLWLCYGALQIVVLLLLLLLYGLKCLQCFDAVGWVALSLASVKSKNTPWSAEHLRLLEKAFMHFKKPPDSKSIKELLTKEPGLQNRSIVEIC